MGVDAMEASSGALSWWQWALHEDKLVDSRLTIFLTANALLVTAAGFAVQRPKPSKPFLYMVCLLGIFITFLWLVVQVQSAKIVIAIESRLGNEFNEFFTLLEKSRWFLLSRNRLMSYFLPPIVLTWWIGLVFAILLGAFK